MGKFKDAAIIILKEAGTPLQYKEIVRRAIEKRILETGGKSPDATMNAEIGVDIKKKGVASDFVKSGPGTYGLNPNKLPVPVVEKPIVAHKRPIGPRPTKLHVIDDKKKVDGSYIGKGGEYLVCGQLLFLGFNASIMSVDTGVDIVATKDNRLFGIQVKTSRLNNAKTFIFDVRKVSFERHGAGGTYYILVLVDETINYIILPYTELQKKVEEKAILEVNHGDRYRITIKIRDSKVYIGQMEHDITYYLNKWSLIV